MGEHGRQFFEYVLVISAPTLAPHLDVVAIAFVVVALAALVTILVIRMTGIRSSLSGRWLVTTFMSAQRTRDTRPARGGVRARAPTVWTA